MLSRKSWKLHGLSCLSPLQPPQGCVDHRPIATATAWRSKTRGFAASRPRLDLGWIHHSPPKGGRLYICCRAFHPEKKKVEIFGSNTQQRVSRRALKSTQKKIVKKNGEGFLKVADPQQQKQQLFLDLQSLKQLPSSKMLPWFNPITFYQQLLHLKGAINATTY